MGKNKKKSLYKKLVKGNKVLLAALGGVAAGVTLSSILGTEKAKEILATVENSIENFTNKITEAASPTSSSTRNPSRRNAEVEPKD